MIPAVRLLSRPEFMPLPGFRAFSPIRNRLKKPAKPGIDKKTSHKRIFSKKVLAFSNPSDYQPPIAAAIAAHRQAPVAQLDRAPDYESGVRGSNPFGCAILSLQKLMLSGLVKPLIYENYSAT